MAVVSTPKARQAIEPTQLSAVTKCKLQGCSMLLDGLSESALQHRVRKVKRLIRNGIRESGNL